MVGSADRVSRSIERESTSSSIVPSHDVLSGVMSRSEKY